MANGDQRGEYRREHDRDIYSMALKSMEVAMQAIAKITTHEEVCKLRQEQIVSKLDVLYRILLIGTVGLISALGAVAWTLFERTLH